MPAQNAASRCPLHLNRRRFLKGLGASALALQTGAFQMASAMAGEAPGPKGTCRLMVAFTHPDVKEYWLGWPGKAYDIAGHQKLYTETMEKAAKAQGVDVDIRQDTIHDDKTLADWQKKIASAKPDGVLFVCMSLNAGWKYINKFLDERGKTPVPTVVFSPMGTSFTGHLQHSRKAKKAFVGATQDVEWLATAVRMLKTRWEMDRTRLCVVRGKKVHDQKLDTIGTTLHWVPHEHFYKAHEAVKESAEMREMAKWYKATAKRIVEPTDEDLLAAAKNYFVCRKVMEDENCHGYSMDCLGPVGQRKMQPPCIALSHFRDEGIVGSCEADWNAAISERLTHLLFNRPGFMQDPAPNTVRNTLMAAHCTCGARLKGCDKDAEPFILRSHSESDLGVAMQVLWPVGDRITIMKFSGPSRIILGTGEIVANIDTPPSGGCRTSVECTVDGVADSRDTKGFHQLLVWGDLEEEYKAYCALAGIEVVHV
ncbi:MAG: hypothetical protein R6X20_00860 [Phycisphaerae bacterium]